ncbi:cytochrome P450 [Breoghania sp.]|uniref:cytochrome P450 n=1 Tax=Breoghania sp. TaxID=2065378 RepID=UPI002AAB105A|nr:cytochrome P450 [Breoghania sp.]
MSVDSQRTVGAIESDVDWWSMLTDPEYLKSPYAQLNALRDKGPVHRDPATGVFFVLGHSAFRAMASAREMGRDTRLWTHGWNRQEVRENDPLTYELFREFQPQMTNANPPDHRRQRGIYEKAYRADGLAQPVRLAEAEVSRLLDALPVGEPIDFMTQVANPLSRSIARDVFDIPPEMEEQLADWVTDLGFIGNIMMSVEQKQNAQKSMREFKTYLRQRFASGTDRPGEGFVGIALKAWADGTMDEEETLNNLVTLIAGGTATATLLGNGLLTLLRHPDQMAKLRADPDLLAPAIEEMLRFEPGCSFIIRVAIEDYECAGARIPEGALAIGLTGATNRDPERFDDPDTFDITRRHNAHHVFGGGAHICLGKTQVRMTAQTLFAHLLERFARIELAGEPVWWTHRSDQHGLHTLPIKLGQA